MHNVVSGCDGDALDTMWSITDDPTADPTADPTDDPTAEPTDGPTDDHSVSPTNNDADDPAAELKLLPLNVTVEIAPGSAVNESGVSVHTDSTVTNVTSAGLQFGGRPDIGLSDWCVSCIWCIDIRSTFDPRTIYVI